MTVFVQPSVRSVSIHPLVEKAIIHLFQYSFLNFATSRLPPLNTIKSLSSVPLPFAASPTVTRHFSCPVVFILYVTVFPQQHPMLYLKPYSPKQVFHRML